MNNNHKLNRYTDRLSVNILSAVINSQTTVDTSRLATEYSYLEDEHFERYISYKIPSKRDILKLAK